MAELSVVILAADEEQRAILQMQVHATAVAKTQQTFAGYPMAASDLISRRIQDIKPDVVLLDIPKQSIAAALHAIEILRADMPNTAVVAIGETNQPQVIITAMRSGAREFLDRPTSTANLLEAFVRLSSAQRKAQHPGQRGKLFTFVNCKGGNGATTVAVNSALAMQNFGGSVALVDLAPLGHAALHLGVSPTFTVVDAFRNVQRLDGSLLEGYMTRCSAGLHLLAGITQPLTDELLTSDFARLFDLLVNQYDFVVVDGSSRIDRALRVVCDLSDTVLIVAQTDVASLWSAVQIQSVLGESLGSDRLRLVVNRYRKVPGFADTDIETATHIKIISKIPNQYAIVAAAIDRGVPVATQNHSEAAHAFVGLASQLAECKKQEKKSKTFTLFAGR